MNACEVFTAFHTLTLKISYLFQHVTSHVKFGWVLLCVFHINRNQAMSVLSTSSSSSSLVHMMNPSFINIQIRPNCFSFHFKKIKRFKENHIKNEKQYLNEDEKEEKRGKNTIKIHNNIKKMENAISSLFIT